jgi:hypothetical protein
LNTKRMSQSINGQMNWADSSQRKKYKWPINTWKNIQHCQPSSKCKSEVTESFSPQSEWLSSRRQQQQILGRCREKESLYTHCWWECRLVQPLCKSVWRFLRKIKIGLPYHPARPLLGMYLKESKSAHSTDACTHLFMAAMFTVAKSWKRWPSTDEWIKKMWHLYIMEYYFAIKNEIMLFAGNKWN